MKFTVVHEIAHDNEIAQGFVKYRNGIENSDLFKKWVAKKASGLTQANDFPSKRAAVSKSYKKSYAKVKSLSNTQAENEMYADFAADVIFNSKDLDGTLLQLEKSFTDKNAFNRFIQAVMNCLRKIKGYFSGNGWDTKVLQYKFAKLQKSVENKNTADEGGVKYKIIVLDNGNTYVKASRDIITGNDISLWRKQITNFFNQLLDGNKILTIDTIEGDTLTITKKDTANKARDNFKQINGKKVKMSNNEFLVKLHAEAHIDELTEISEKSEKSSDKKSHIFAKDGFSYRTAYFQDFNGDYYKITLSIGNSNNIATVYNVGKIKTDKLPSAKIIAAVGSKTLGNSSVNTKITQNNPDVNSIIRKNAENDTLISTTIRRCVASAVYIYYQGCS